MPEAEIRVYKRDVHEAGSCMACHRHWGSVNVILLGNVEMRLCDSCLEIVKEQTK